VLPRTIKGRARAVVEAATFAALPRPDIIWTSVSEVLTPHLWAQLGPLRRPLVLDLDWTLEQQEMLAPTYYDRPAKRGLVRHVRRQQERALWHSVSLFTPWSNWAAESLRQQGVRDHRIRVLPPGIDLDQWRSASRPVLQSNQPLRLLMVGGDFVRKGGDVLLHAVQTQFGGRVEVDIVTREPPPVLPSGVRTHATEANSPLLRSLYAQADLFVLPTRADTFGIATIEAMASGLPVIVSDLGGARDIVIEGETGWLIQPTAPALADALERALAQRSRLRAMGELGRRVSEERFDARRNATCLVDVLLEQLGRA
jgi:glycosyltransferase involved in cell wall biosynthesis